MTSQARVEFQGHFVLCLNVMLLHIWSVKTELCSCFHFICYCCFVFYLYFMCGRVSFCSPSWSGTQNIAQASLKLMMGHLSAGIINLSLCTPADLSRQIQRQRGVVSKSCLQKQQFPSLQWVRQRQMHIYVASTCNLGQKRLSPSSSHSHWCLFTNSTTINEICEND